MRHVRRGGAYFRVCDPAWVDPSDTKPSKRIGGRWNPPDRPGRPGFGALYLNRSLAVSRENARRYVRQRTDGAATLDDILPSALPDLQHYTIAEADFLDAVTPEGIGELGLAERYPTAIPHPPCQGIAEAAYAAGDPGVAVLSAVAPTEEELAVFDRAVAALAVKDAREPFTAWF
ncbi:MAG: hypothetical protein QOI11_9 [Candidatus Eremiobacteraeota bacterium]|nr:hypothetical protein [Candidatus Eremiobacteraeota bacterium]